MLHLLLVDVERLICDILPSALALLPDVESVEQVADWDSALLAVSQRAPDVILINPEPVDADPFSAIASLGVIAPQCRVLVLTARDCDAEVQRAIDAGAVGYVLRQEGFDALRMAIEEVAHGRTFFSESIRWRLRPQAGNGRLVVFRPRSDTIARLTERERELLSFLASGASLKEASVLMGVSYKTADNQKTSLMRKLGIHDRVELARFAIREGLVSASSRPRRRELHATPSPVCV